VTVRFLADENLDTGIIMGLRAREPAIDILGMKTPDYEEWQIRRSSKSQLSRIVF